MQHPNRQNSRAEKTRDKKMIQSIYQKLRAPTTFEREANDIIAFLPFKECNLLLFLLFQRK